MAKKIADMQLNTQSIQLTVHSSRYPPESIAGIHRLKKTPLLLKTSKLSFYYFLDHFNTLNDATWTTAALYMPGVKPVEEIQACMFPAKNFGR